MRHRLVHELDAFALGSNSVGNEDHVINLHIDGAGSPLAVGNDEIVSDSEPGYACPQVRKPFACTAKLLRVRRVEDTERTLEVADKVAIADPEVLGDDERVLRRQCRRVPAAARYRRFDCQLRHQQADGKPIGHELLGLPACFASVLDKLVQAQAVSKDMVADLVGAGMAPSAGGALGAENDCWPFGRVHAFKTWSRGKPDDDAEALGEVERINRVGRADSQIRAKVRGRSGGFDRETTKDHFGSRGPRMLVSSLSTLSRSLGFRLASSRAAS